MAEFSNHDTPSQPFGEHVVTRHFVLRTALSIAYARLGEILQTVYVHTPEGGVEFQCERRIDREGERADFKLTPHIINLRIAGWEVSVVGDNTIWQSDGLMVTRSAAGIYDAAGGTEEDQARAVQEMRRLEAEVDERVGRIVAEARFVRFDLVAVAPDEVRVAVTASGAIAAHAMGLALSYARALWGARLMPAQQLPSYPTKPDDERLTAARLGKEERQWVALTNSGYMPAEIADELNEWEKGQKWEREQYMSRIRACLSRVRKKHPDLIRPAQS
ncbi:MAG: hypothetical protein ACFLMY_04995 [Candidatus Brachytrichaceae bacterium NZ_4S206]|jgi:hypothetical protein